jgi:tetratricopeptide (TPR) repeat protein
MIKPRDYISTLMKVMICFLTLSSPMVVRGQAAPDWIKTMKSGNLQYKQNDFAAAESTYLEAEKIAGEQPINEYGNKFNLGNAQYRQKKYKESISSYESAFDNAKTSEEKANALYNKGNTEYLAEDYQSALKSYKDALKYNPKDGETIDNLAKTKLKIIEEKQNKPPEDEDGKKQENQDQNNQDQDPKKQENQDQKGQNQDQNQDQKDQGQKDGKSDEKQPNQDNQSKESQSDKGDNSDITKPGMSKEYLQRLLKMIEDEEKSIQQKLRKQNVKTSKQSKDW